LRLTEEVQDVTVSRPQVLTAFLAALTIMAVSAYLAYPNAVPDFRPDQDYDGFMYVHLANDIGNGLGYRTKHWMPGFPYLLSWLIGVFGLDYLKLKLSIVAFGVGTYAATFAYVRCIAVQLAHRHLIAWVVTLSVALTPLLFDYSHRLMSEIPALCCAMTALWLCEVVRRSESPRMLLTAAVALSALCGLAVLMRGNGLALVPALLVSAAYDWRARRRAAIACVVAATLTMGLFVGWSARNANQTYVGIHNITYLQEIQARNVGALWRAGGFNEGVERVTPGELARRVYQNGMWYHLYGIADGVVPGIRSLVAADTSRLGTPVVSVPFSP
jgi:4-amino-4-deoxy-L-arabinose transferase-like glycosyltransferase